MFTHVFGKRDGRSVRVQLSAILMAVLLAWVLPAVAAPVVSNVQAVQRASGDRGAVEITYDLLEGNALMAVSVVVSRKNGASWDLTPNASSLRGDVGNGITNGLRRQIVWDAKADVPEVYWPQTRVRVIATEQSVVPSPVPVEVSSTAPAGGVFQEAAQTLSFVFAAPVTGFDASDVVVTGAQKGAFAGSGTAYTLAITATGGRIEVSPTAGVWTPANAPASLSLFYHDIWTLQLPDNVTMELIHNIPGGSFRMGSPFDEVSRNSDEVPHDVTLTQDYYLSRTEVTQAQWLAVAETFPQAQFTNVNDTRLPVHRVSWDDIMELSSGYMKRLSDHLASTAQPTGFVSLPTEAQWERAARAGTTTRFSFGDGLSTDEFCSLGGGREQYMVYCGNSVGYHQVVAQKQANPYGLFDMHGNVAEWCSDWFGDYDLGNTTDPQGPVTGTARHG